MKRIVIKTKIKLILPVLLLTLFLTLNASANGLEKVPSFSGKSIEDLFDNDADIKKRIDSLVKGNDHVLPAVFATLAEIVKEDNGFYSCQGELPWGDGLSITIVFFNVKDNKIYIGNKLGSKKIILKEDENVPFKLMQKMEDL